MLLLWADDKALEIYNTARWAAEGDNLVLARVWEKLEAYVRPRSNQILARYQLRWLTQGEKTLEEFLTRARILIEDSGYPNAVREETLRDTLVFGLKSEKIRREAIAIGNDLTFQQVYDLAKAEESTVTQMNIISKGSQPEEVHSVRSRRPPQSSRRQKQDRDRAFQKDSNQPKAKNFSKPSKPCGKCGGNHAKREECPAKSVECHLCGKVGHYKRVCRSKNQVNEMYQDEGDEFNAYTLSDIGSINATKTINDVVTHTEDSGQRIEKIFAVVTLNDKYKLRLKVDSGSNACTLTTADLEKFKITEKIRPSGEVLNIYGGGTLENRGCIPMKISFRGKSVHANFKVVKSPGNPSLLGCSQAIALEIITLNIHAVASSIPRPLTREQVLRDYSDCFDKIGKFPGEKYTIKLRDDAKPVIHAPRTVPVHIMPYYEAELKKMLKEDIISPVTEPTEWVNSIVVNVKETPKGKKVRLCLDPKDLNKSIRREHYYSRTIDEILPGLHKKKYFSVVDTKKGYWHVELDDESSLLTTFNTPFGRFKFNRCPFGIKSSQDAFQPKLDEVYAGIKNVSGIADDIIVAGETPEEHDEAMVKMLEASRRNNIGLNSEKLQFKQSSVNFFGHKITDEGIQPAEDKLQAIKDMKSPTNAKELLTILGMITYLNRFSTRLAELTAPLRELQKKEVHFSWEKRHQAALDAIKAELCNAKILSYYDPDPKTTTILQCDASQLGLGAWLRQIDSTGKEKIVAMCSRGLHDAETRYSNIERECLAVKFGLEKFEYYLMGRHTIVESDHSPLEQIFKKNIAEVPVRLQNMIIRCLRFDINVVYKPGVKVPVADALSRMCMPAKKADEPRDINFVTGIESPIDLQRIREACLQDATSNLLKNAVFKGWPDQRKHCPQELWDYWNFRCDLTIEDGLVHKADRIVIPKALRQEVKNAIHTGHQGENKCVLLARQSVFWPGMTKEIREMVQDCSSCAEHQAAPSKLPILQPELPTRAWQKLGTDIFEFEHKKYLVIADYYSRYILVRQLPTISAEAVCSQFSSVLTEYGLPETIVADFGTQYTSADFRKKCRDSNIEIKYSSPYHHQANSVAERAVGTIKHLWKKSRHSKTTALWMYRITPIDSNLPSPYELLFGRKPKSFLPSKLTNSDQHLPAMLKRQEDQAKFYNRRAGPDQRQLNPGEDVNVYNTLAKVWEPATVVRADEQPRTYIVEKNNKQYRRTQQHIKPSKPTTNEAETPTANLDNSQDSIPAASNQVQAERPATPAKQPYTTRSGRVVNIPERYNSK